MRTIPPKVGCINLILSRLQSVAYQLEDYGLTGKHLLPDTFHQIIAHDAKEKMLTKVAKDRQPSQAHEEKRISADFALHLFVVCIVVGFQCLTHNKSKNWIHAS